MNDSERPSELFERLWLLRRCYPLRSRYDAASTISVAEAIAYGEREMRLSRWHARRTWPGSSRQVV